MEVLKAAELLGLKVFSSGRIDAEIKSVYCCDIPSICLSKLAQNSAWVTVLGNLNSVAVAFSAGASCIVLPYGIAPIDKKTVDSAKAHGIWILGSDKDIFSTALDIHNIINN